MIRMLDAAILAYTKLQVHRMRTGITVGIAGILFGILLAIVLLSQGIFNSIEGFRGLGLNDRYVVSVTNSSFHPEIDVYNLLEDEKFVGEVESAHSRLVAKKQQAAAKYQINYQPEIEDPSPIVIDKISGKKLVSESIIGSSLEQLVMEARLSSYRDSFSIEEFVSPYSSAKQRGEFNSLIPASGSLEYMLDGKEVLTEDGIRGNVGSGPSWMNDQSPDLAVLDSSLAEPFITAKTAKVDDNEVPVIIPYGQAEKLLGYAPLDTSTPREDRYQRLSDVKSRISEVTASFCYRNAASIQLLSLALSQQAEQKEVVASGGSWVSPAVRYKVPDPTECGAVEIIEDNRSPEEKEYAKRQLQYEQAVGDYIGAPEQQKITVRGVGVSSSYPSNESFSVEQIINSILATPLGYGSTWAIPSDMLAQASQSIKGSPVFEDEGRGASEFGFSGSMYLVEFEDELEAKSLLEDYRSFNDGYESTFVTTFGSNSLVVDEVQSIASRVIVWMLAGVSGVAIVILAGTIGRTVSDGRKESAVFRAIGARRSDIAKIYGVYTILLSLRIILFALVLGFFLAGILEVLYAEEATLGARLAYAADSSTEAPEFHFIGVNSWYILAIAGMVLVAGLLASILPIIRNVRRNPINDMRDE